MEESKPLKLYPFDPTPADEINTRINRIMNLMDRQGPEAVLLTHKPDIFYFSGSAQDCYLYIHRENGPILFARRYLPRVMTETCIPIVEQIQSITDIPKMIKGRFRKLPETCGTAFDVIPVRDFHFLEKLFASTRLVDATPLIDACRQIKSPWEIQQMEKAALVSQKTFDYMARTIREGLTEMEFCGMFEAYSRTLGHSGTLLTRHYRLEGFPFHLMSGSNGGLPGALDSPVCGTGTSNAYPYGAGPKPLKNDEPVLIDFGTHLNGYHIDESRMFVMGKMPKKALDASLAAIEVLHQVKEKMVPGADAADLFAAAVKKADALGFKDQFLGLPGLKSKFIGHGVGLELVESPVIAEGKHFELMPGMVFAVEPKFIFKDHYAAGIESMIHVTEKASRYLSLTENKIFTC